jgi:hypothetical protein
LQNSPEPGLSAPRPLCGWRFMPAAEMCSIIFRTLSADGTGFSATDPPPICLLGWRPVMFERPPPTRRAGSEFRTCAMVDWASSERLTRLARPQNHARLAFRNLFRLSSHRPDTFLRLDFRVPAAVPPPPGRNCDAMAFLSSDERQFLNRSSPCSQEDRLTAQKRPFSGPDIGARVGSETPGTGLYWPISLHGLVSDAILRQFVGEVAA